MKIASVSELKKELKHLENEELIELLSNLMKYSKENKELLNYLLFESEYEENYIEKIKGELNVLFQQLDRKSWKSMKKPLQRIVRTIKKQLKYSKKPVTEIEVLIHFCLLMKELKPSFKRFPVILNIYLRQIVAIEKAMITIHEDLRGDYNENVKELKEFLN